MTFPPQGPPGGPERCNVLLLRVGIRAAVGNDTHAPLETLLPLREAAAGFVYTIGALEVISWIWVFWSFDFRNPLLYWAWLLFLGVVGCLLDLSGPTPVHHACRVELRLAHTRNSYRLRWRRRRRKKLRHCLRSKLKSKDQVHCHGCKWRVLWQCRLVQGRRYGHAPVN